MNDLRRSVIVANVGFAEHVALFPLVPNVGHDVFLIDREHSHEPVNEFALTFSHFYPQCLWIDTDYLAQFNSRRRSAYTDIYWHYS